MHTNLISDAGSPLADTTGCAAVPTTHGRRGPSAGGPRSLAQRRVGHATDALGVRPLRAAAATRSGAVAARSLPLAIAVAILVSLGGRGAVAQARNDSTPSGAAIPAGAWDDDWWYPEGRIVLFGRRYSLSAGFGLTRFADRSTRDTFGSWKVGPRFNLYRPDDASGLGPDFDFAWIGLGQDGRRAGYIAPTLGVRYAPVAATRGRWIVPRARLRIGPYFADAATAGHATVLGANAEVGVEIGRILSLTARYDRVRGVRGYDLSTVAMDMTARVPIRASRRARPKMRDDVPPPGRMVDVGGHRLHLVCAGAGSPTVVLESGMADAWVVWDRLLPELARTTRTCAYDRAGIGYSEPGPLPRDSRRIAAELHTLLERAGERPPYVLVGHSFGGLHVRRFAGDHPEQVVGMVLVDATHEEFLVRCSPEVRERLRRGAERSLALAERGEQGQRLPPVVSNLPRAIASRPAWYRTAYEEARAAEASAAEARTSDLGVSIPLTVITGGKSAGVAGRTGAATRALWSELQADLAQRSPQAVQVVARRSGHYVQRSDRQLVVAEVRRMVERVRSPQ
jgi:pimeloyl-ACP methyl ester carboxylesterase